MGAVGEHALVRDRLDHRLFPVLLRLVRIQRVRSAQDLFEVGLVHLIRQDRRSFRHRRA